MRSTPPYNFMNSILEIPAEIHDAMVAHCVREAPLECCGLLGGVAPLVSSFHPLRNASASEVRYDADTGDLIEAVQSLRARKAEILAIYHSHPRWVAIPSKTDPTTPTTPDRVVPKAEIETTIASEQVITKTDTPETTIASEQVITKTDRKTTPRRRSNTLEPTTN